MNLNEVIAQFSVGTDVAPYGEGHINDTYLARVAPDKYILQRINHNVFKEPERLMENIVAVTEHLRGKIAARGGDPERETLTVIKTNDGADFYRSADGDYFRMYIFLDDTDTYQTVERPEQLYNAARAFGRFQNDLADFPAERLFESIPSFHNTVVRFENLLKAIETDKVGRKREVDAEIAFALAREADTAVIVEAIVRGEVPLRVTHNDTKINNVLFDKATGEGICVIDLDTVMPGSLLYDFGEAIRTGASMAVEDETDLSKVGCNLELFEAFARGFLEEVGGGLTPKELELLPFAVKLMTYENGIRFLTDYLEGDTYFKIHRPGHNLDRCRAQFRLVEDIESKMERMREIIGVCTS
ncbi:mucin desulfatase [Clostridia bacterium]|nr:mucin desulfatase [Clostridia bacterium]